MDRIPPPATSPQRVARNTVLVTTLMVIAAASPSSGQDFEGAKRTVLEQVNGLSSEIRGMAMTLWDFSETALLETRSAEYLADLLEQEGFTLERGVSDLPTAFVATFGSGRPVLGILAEFDALPGIGNAPVPERAPREDDHPHGQGCGHNLFGAGSVGAAIALKRTMESEGLAGTIKLYGTPAEETVVGKVYMARDGLFDGLDAVLEWHPGLETEVNNNPGRAMNNFQVEFYGQAAHSSFDPWNGRSALDAVELMNDGANLMREHVLPSTRIHYVIPSAGEAPNVVPEYARVWYYVRDVDREKVQEWYDWLLKIAEGAAMGTRTTHEVTLITGVHAYNLNRPLQEALQANMEALGEPEYPEAFHDFARQLQAFLGIEQKGLNTAIKPLADGEEEASGGSTDVAEVSRIVPTAGISVTSAAADIPWHSWATSASHGTEGSVVSAHRAAQVLALTGVDILTNPDLVQRAQAFFQEKTGGKPYESPLPLGQKPILPAGR